MGHITIGPMGIVEKTLLHECRPESIREPCHYDPTLVRDGTSVDTQSEELTGGIVFKEYSGWGEYEEASVDPIV